MKAPPFSYSRPSSLADALSLLEGEDVKALAGGQSLLASLAFRLSSPVRLVDISRLPELKGITLAGNHLRIGAATTHAELGQNHLVRTYASLLAEATKHIAHPAIRNRGTIGGSIAYADPASELPACIVALDAELVLVAPTGERRLPADEFFTGVLSTNLNDGELIKAIEVPIQTPNDRVVIVEVARRSGDYAMAGVAAKLTLDADKISAARIVFFGVGDKPALATHAAAALEGQPLHAVSIDQARNALDSDLNPPADQHGDSDMKRHLARVVLVRALMRMQGAVS